MSKLAGMMNEIAGALRLSAVPTCGLRRDKRIAATSGGGCRSNVTSQQAAQTALIVWVLECTVKIRAA